MLLHLDVMVELRGEECCDEDRLAGVEEGGGRPA